MGPRRLGLGLLVALAAAGCGAASSGPPKVAGVGPGVPAAPVRPLPQVSNGPLAIDPQTTPIALQLSDVDDPVRPPFKRPPRSGVLFDADTGEVLWRRAPTRIVPIASLTKMMTAILVDEQLEEDDLAPITKEVLGYVGSGVGVLGKAKRVRVRTLLHGLLLVSGNDAAIALGLRTAGTQKAFVRQMNARATKMGLSCTRFASPSGIVDRGNHSCAADLAALARELLDHPDLAAIVRKRTVSLPFPIKGGRLAMRNTNPLLRAGYPGIVGVKTGYTDAAGRCLVAVANRRGRRLGVVLLDSVDPGRQARVLLDAGFAAGQGA